MSSKAPRSGENGRVRSRWSPHRDKPRPTPFARWLTEHRLARNLRQSDLAYALRVHSGRISELETGARRPSRDLARRLHLALGEGVPAPPWPPDGPGAPGDAGEPAESEEAAA